MKNPLRPSAILCFRGRADEINFCVIRYYNNSLYFIPSSLVVPAVMMTVEDDLDEMCQPSCHTLTSSAWRGRGYDDVTWYMIYYSWCRKVVCACPNHHIWILHWVKLHTHHRCNGIRYSLEAMTHEGRVIFLTTPIFPQHSISHFFSIYSI